MPFNGDTWSNHLLQRALYWEDREVLAVEVMEEFRLMASEIVALRKEVQRFKEILHLAGL